MASRSSRTIQKPPRTPAPLSDPSLLAAYQTPAGLAHLASNGRFTLPPHLALLDEKLYDLATGRIKRLMVFMPPRHGKSLLCSQFFPAWYIGRFKGRIILTSYEASFASTWGRLSRNVLTEFGPSVFGVDVSMDSSAADHWELTEAQGQYGVMYTAGVGGAITGKGASLLIIDDPVKNMAEAMSPTLREKAWSWYTSTAYTRLEPDGRVLVIQTRWHEDDLSGRILAGATEAGDAEPWTVISLPAIADQDEMYPLLDGAPFSRKEGEPLWPARFSAERLQQIKQEVGGQVWTALYQQRPAPAGGYIWRREWFRRYREVPAGITRVVQAIDTAFKTGVASDYSVIATWAMTATGFYLLDCWRARVEFPDLKHAILDQHAKWRPTAIYLEDAASGQSALQELRRETNLPLIPVKPTGSKEARAAAVSPLGEAGRVFVPEAEIAPWIADWLEEHISFPNAPHDDMVDTTSMALERLRAATGGVAFAAVSATGESYHGYSLAPEASPWQRAMAQHYLAEDGRAAAGAAPGQQVMVVGEGIQEPGQGQGQDGSQIPGEDAEARLERERSERMARILSQLEEHMGGRG